MVALCVFSGLQGVVDEDGGRERCREHSGGRVESRLRGALALFAQLRLAFPRLVTSNIITFPEPFPRIESSLFRLDDMSTRLGRVSSRAPSIFTSDASHSEQHLSPHRRLQR